MDADTRVDSPAATGDAAVDGRSGLSSVAHSAENLDLVIDARVGAVYQVVVAITGNLAKAGEV
jgi:hypothetical protein